MRGTLVVGGGLSGLALAFELSRRGEPVSLLDAGERPGGNIRTRRATTASGQWLLEEGPNSFGDASTELMSLVDALDIRDDLLPASEEGGRRWLYRGGRLREVPSSPLRFFASPILPLGGRLRLLKEPFVRPRPADAPEESLAAFCDRRLGRAAREKLLTPVVGGIYAGDPERLGATSAFPRMVELERRHGSLIRAAIRGNGPPSRGRLCSFREGLEQLPWALAARLAEALESGVRVESLMRDGAGWRIGTSEGERRADRVVLATPSWVSSKLLEKTSPEIAADLAAIRHAPMAVVHVGYRRDALGALPPGFGFLVPRREGLRILGTIFSSQLFAGRAPDGRELLTVFSGGSLDPAAFEMTDADLTDLVLGDLERALGARGDPELVEITRWPRAIPQYEVEHADRLARVDAALAGWPGLHLHGNWRGGIAMPACAAGAVALADVLTKDASTPDV